MAATAVRDLRKITIVYEDRESWVKNSRIQASPEAREELSQWLLSNEDIVHTHEALSNVAGAKGVSIDLVTIDDFVENFSIKQPGDDHDLIWNITDGHACFRGSHITSLATLANTPYFGCPPYAQALAQDKFKLFLLCRAIGIPVPRSALAEGGVLISSFLEEMTGPYFIKPNSGGNKIGLDELALQDTLAGAVTQAAEINRRLCDQAIIQEFIAGPEVRLSFINANAADDVRIPMFGYDVINSTHWQTHTPVFVSYQQRESAYTGWQDLWSWSGMNESERVRAIKGMTSAVTLLAQFVRLKDYFTIDFRIDACGIPRLLDFNSGAFLEGAHMTGYTMNNLHMPLHDAIFSAMQNSFYARHPKMFRSEALPFRI